MSDEALFEKWRRERSRLDPPEEFADRVMQEIQALPVPDKAMRNESSPPGTVSDGMRSRKIAGLGVVAAAALAALFRIVELLSVFSATGIDN